MSWLHVGAHSELFYACFFAQSVVLRALSGVRLSCWSSLAVKRGISILRCHLLVLNRSYSIRALRHFDLSLICHSLTCLSLLDSSTLQHMSISFHTHMNVFRQSSLSLRDKFVPRHRHCSNSLASIWSHTSSLRLHITHRRVLIEFRSWRAAWLEGSGRWFLSRGHVLSRFYVSWVSGDRVRSSRDEFLISSLLSVDVRCFERSERIIWTGWLVLVL